MQAKVVELETAFNQNIRAKEDERAISAQKASDSARLAEEVPSRVRPLNQKLTECLKLIEVLRNEDRNAEKVLHAQRISGDAKANEDAEALQRAQLEAEDETAL
jgi:hypothetical protein